MTFKKEKGRKEGRKKTLQVFERKSAERRLKKRTLEVSVAAELRRKDLRHSGRLEGSGERKISGKTGISSKKGGEIIK